MFGFFKRGNKGKEDPLSDLKTVSRWMQQLPVGDIYSAQERVVQSLIQFNHAGLPMSKDRLQVLMHLDEQARDMQYSLCVQYLRNPRMSKLIESRLWTAIHAFYWEITRGYHAFLMDFVANPGGSKIQSIIPLLTARAIRGFSDIFKWRYFRYERAEEKLWLRLHNLYRIAEFDGFQSNRFSLYDNEAKPSSCMEEYVQALLLGPLGTGSLNARQIEMVDQWLDNWSDLTTLDQAYDTARHFFMVDTALGHGLRRIRANSDTEPSYRYISSANLLARLEEVERNLKAGALPPSLGLGEEFRLPDGYDLISYAASEWSPSTARERRNSHRVPTDGHCEVIRDLSNICNRMIVESEISSGIAPGKTLSHEEILDIKLYGFVTDRTKLNLTEHQKGRLDATLDHWPLQDQSETGIGVILNADQVEWIKIGKLVAIRPDPGSDWKIGIIRRITRLDQEGLKVGVQILGDKPNLVQLEPDKAQQDTAYSVDDADYTEGPFSNALVFPNLEDGRLILLESAKYAHETKYKMRDRDSVAHVRLNAVRERGDGWLLAIFTRLD